MNTGGDAAELRAALRAVADPGTLLEADADAAPFLSDHRRQYQGRALAVALPRSVAEISRLLAWCNARRVGVVPQGGNTGYCGGATPDESGRQLVIGLQRLNRIRDINPADFSMTVEAGCLLAAVQQAAAAAGRFFPLELGSSGSCQIGGNPAPHARGLKVLRFRMARHLTLGIETALSPGRVFHRPRSLPQDNTPYELRRL